MSSGLPFTGLSADEVTISRDAQGSNVLTPSARDPWWKLYLEKFNDPVIRILIIAAVIATLAGAYHGDYIEGIGILLAIILALSALGWLAIIQAARLLRTAVAG